MWPITAASCYLFNYDTVCVIHRLKSSLTSLGFFFLLHGVVWVEFLKKVNELFPLMQHLWEIEQRCKWMKGFGPVSHLSDAQQTQCFVYSSWHQRAFRETRPLTFLPQKALLFVSSLRQQGLGVDLVSLREWSVAKLMETRDTYRAAAWALALCICLNSAGGSCHDKNTPKSPAISSHCPGCYIST